VLQALRFRKGFRCRGRGGSFSRRSNSSFPHPAAEVQPCDIIVSTPYASTDLSVWLRLYEGPRSDREERFSLRDDLLSREGCVRSLICSPTGIFGYLIIHLYIGRYSSLPGPRRWNRYLPVLLGREYLNVRSTFTVRFASLSTQITK
jgi:hypothetical protein